MRHATAVQRSGVFAELPALLAEAGVAPDAAFAGSGIDPSALSAEARLPFVAMVQVIERAARLTGCPHLGLLLGSRFQLAHHGVMGELMRTAATLGEALRDFAGRQPGYSSGAVVYLQPMGEDMALGYGAAGAGSRVLYDTVLAVGVKMLQHLTEGAVRPDEAHIPFRPPPDRGEHARLLRMPVRFNQQRACLVLSARDLETPLPGADAAGHRAALATMKSALAAAAPATTLRTRHALRRLLQEGPPRMEAVASELAMHPRTLRRRLAAEQTSFDALCESIRYEMAREFLAFTDLPVGDIGAALAYASPGVFSDAFHRWSGLSPLAWRRQTAAARGCAASA